MALTLLSSQREETITSGALFADFIQNHPDLQNQLSDEQISALNQISAAALYINSYFNNYPNLDLKQLIIHNDIKIIYDSILIIYNFCQIIFYVLSLEEL